MHHISCLPTSDEDPKIILKEKYATKEEVYSRFGAHRGKRGLVIPNINNPIIRFTIMLLACKLIHKYRKYECTLEVVLTTEQCVGGTQMA